MSSPTEDVKKGKCLGVYRGHEGTVYSLDVGYKGSKRPSSSDTHSRGKGRVNPSDQDDQILLVTGSHDQLIVIWEVQPSITTQNDLSVKVFQSKKFKGHTSDVFAVNIITDHDSKRLGNLVSGGDYSIRTWNTDNGTPTQVLQGHTGYVACLKVRGKRAFSGSWDTTIRSWNLDNGKAMHVFKGHKNIVNCLDVTDTDIFSGSWDSSVIQWSRAVRKVETGEQVHFYQGHTDGVQCLQVFEDFLYSGSMDKTIRVWNIKNAKTVKIFRGHQGGVECLHVVAGFCFSGSYDKTIRCFNIDTTDCVAIFGGHTDGIYCLKVFNGILYSGSGDKSVRLWDVRDIVQKKPKPWWAKLGCC